MKKFNIRKYRELTYPFINQISSGNLVIARYGELSNLNIDFDVYLPTLKMNLQRDFVWKDYQKQEFILSIFKKVILPPVSVIINDTEEEKKYLIIDGKQRIKTIIDFLSNAFPVIIDKDKYYFESLDDESKSFLKNHLLCGYVMYSSDLIDPISDFQKIQWFSYINFAGTPQDKKHKDQLLDLIK